LNVEPVCLQVLTKEFLDYVEANRSEKYARLVKQFTERWLSAFGLRNADDGDYAPDDSALRHREEERQMQD
jgi:hypothetical protein